MSLVLPGIQSSSVSTQATCTCRSCKLELFLRATAMGGRNILSKMFCSLFMLDNWVWYNGWLVGYGTVVLRKLERSRDCWKLFSMLIGKPCEPIIMKHYQEPMKTVTKINEWFQPNFVFIRYLLGMQTPFKTLQFLMPNQIDETSDDDDEAVDCSHRLACRPPRWWLLGRVPV